MFRCVYAFLVLLVPLPVLADAKFDRQVIDPYVEVDGRVGLGAGVVLNIDGQLLVLTAAHVANCSLNEDGSYSPMQIKKQHDTENMTTVWTCDVVAICHGADLALLKPRIPVGLKPANFGAITPLERGEDCWYVGTAHGIHAGLEKSIVNRPFVTIRNHEFTAINGCGWYGNSGGPLFVKRRDDYMLVGIIVQIAALQDPKTPLLAERLEAMAAFIDAYRQAKIEPPVMRKQDDSMFQHAKRELSRWFGWLKDAFGVEVNAKQSAVTWSQSAAWRGKSHGSNLFARECRLPAGARHQLSNQHLCRSRSHGHGAKHRHGWRD
jgi:hypothetical protein